jgi:hypothetical protein
MRPTTFVLGILVGVIFSSALVTAWSPPTEAPPDGNVAPPINVGNVNQVKNAGLSVNALAVFGNAIISTVGGYLNFGATPGASGYGFRDSAGVMEVKSVGGSWYPIATSTTATSGLGVGQTWQPRANFQNNIAYQNTTGVPIMVIISIRSGGEAWISTNGSNWLALNSSPGDKAPLSFIVPPGHFYRYTDNDSATHWVELR